MSEFKFYRQPDEKDCASTCLRMIAKHYGRNISLDKLRKLSETTREGASLMNVSKAAEKIGFRTLGAKVNLEVLMKKIPLPCILHWNQNHFVVLITVNNEKLKIADPARGIQTVDKKEFLLKWIGENASSNESQGVTLLFEPTPRLKLSENDDESENKGFSFLFKYILIYKRYLFQLLVGIIVGGLIQLALPFLTQSVVDVGIQNSDINFIYLILIAQASLFIGRLSVEVISGWILLHLSTRINIALVSDFFIKLMNLPISFFDTKMTGDIMQRIEDNQRVEKLLTSSSIRVIFSIVTLVIFGIVLALYNLQIFLIFAIASILYFVWITLFLKRRKTLDYKRFEQSSKEQSKVIEIINGMQDIKLHNAERQKRWSWENLQVKLFSISVRYLTLEQVQTTGSSLINELKNIVIVIFSAKLVIDGNITLGMMMAISYITGQLNNPIMQLVGFIHSVQDAKISLERLSEIHGREDEEDNSEKITDVPISSGFNLEKVSFRYVGSDELVLKDLNLRIPANQITAIVGVSGSGKTTLVKTLLKFYEPIEGIIRIGEYNLTNISQHSWRNQCGVVMQEGYIFNDSIANNIAIGQDSIDKKKMERAIEIANIQDFINRLPLGLNTEIGMEGIGISTGQKQRLLIARAVYKDPKFLFFDEATSALDAKNERQIMEKLNSFFKNRTVVIVAHRLSTVKNADQIVVLDQGKIIEKGTHDELVKLEGSYFNLVKNQLELGK